jgi:hypothetical protein
MENLLGQGRAAIDLIVDENSFEENALADLKLPYEDYGPGPSSAAPALTVKSAPLLLTTP